jgi:hypothetical protein
MIKYAGVEFANFSSEWKQGPAAMTNKKQNNFGQMYADNHMKHDIF